MSLLADVDFTNAQVENKIIGEAEATLMELMSEFCFYIHSKEMSL